ncbi:MAG: FecR domain-containing protein [Sphingobacteriales bacterium]
MSKNKIADLLARYQSGQCTPEEKALVDEWFAAHGAEQTSIEQMNAEEQDAWASALFSEINSTNKENDRKIIPISVNRRLWPRIAAAASILLFISAGSYFLLHKKQPNQQIAQTKPFDIKPGSKKAILQLANGQQIALNEAPTGKLAQQGNATVTKTADGQVSYIAQNSTAPTADIYNTITTRRGGYYPLKMADGTIAILDAASSIRYPVTFNGKERRVEITGQVYFIVAHNADKPFKVMVKDQVIQDIGTEFNINAYGDEPYIRTTLVEGGVKVTKQQQSVLLVPGQQAVADMEKNTLRIQTANVSDVIAWKNGQTSFNNEDIQEIMRKVSRWYDVDVQYEGQIPTRGFDGSISRNANLSDLLKILEFNNIHFKVDGKTITVKP